MGLSNGRRGTAQKKKITGKNRRSWIAFRQQLAELEKISNMTMEEAKELLLKRAREEMVHEMAMMVKEVENQSQIRGGKTRP